MRHILSFLAICLIVATGVPASAQDPVTQTRESIMERQRGLGLSGDYSLPSGQPPAPEAVQPGSVPQLGTRGYASDSDIWRALRDGSANATPSSSTAASQLMQVIGDDWRMIRHDYLIKYAGWVLLGVILLIALFYLIRGRIMIRGGRAGKTIPRFSMSHRIAHWFLASTFILMALSGLIILLGRPVLVKGLGEWLMVGQLGMDDSVVTTLKSVNGVLNSAALQGHNLFGPVFILSLLIVIVRFMKGNFFQKADFGWILKGGGLIGGHASSNHYNFGEKTWYWVVVLVGLMISVTGLFLLFPWLSDNLRFHQAATILHAIGALGMICFAMGHAYVGSVGMEGSLDSMLRGEVDVNWAKEHHDLWYEEVTGEKVSHDHDDTAATGAGTAEGTA
ncbi:formate dehydrogenase subunit gamma [Seohaeicola saemankumensis]|nr:formate dehydrogenase subunit gamma [Seohaeicola saemankumensis]MCA0869837.1 formate dehydrogenase subunit gamma [Seohaeicola saemankumensis]